MAKEYTFRYVGSRESFLELLDPSHRTYGRIYYLDPYMVEVREDQISFGIERTGHAGGNWFVADLREEDGEIRLHGTVEYIGPEDNRTAKQKRHDKIKAALLVILVLPFVLVSLAVDWIGRLVNKARRQPYSTEEKLLDLMENRLHCKRVTDDTDS